MRNTLPFILILLFPVLVQAQQLPGAPCLAIAAHTSASVAAAGLPDISKQKQQATSHPEVALRWQELQQPGALDAERRKTIDKTFKVSKSDLLAIENRFGKIEVNTWPRNEMRVKVDVVVRASTDSKAQEIIDNIRIIDIREGSTISFKTDMAPMRISGNTQKSFEVNYTVFMPAENPLAVNNTYGDVYLPDLKGKADIIVKYGSLKSERLGSSDNRVKLSYGSGNCAFINGGSIQVAYADFNLGGANNLQGASKFSDFKIGNMGQQLSLELKYGSFKVDKVSKDIRRISLDSGFSPIALNFEDNTSFKFDVSVQFADFKVDKSLIDLTSQEKDYTSAEYKGSYGNSSSNGMVTIISKYGDVKFTR